MTLYRWIRPYAGWLIGAAGSALLFAVTRLAMGGYIKTVTDSSLQFSERQLTSAAIGMALLAAAGIGAKYMIRFSSCRFASYTVRDIRQEAARRLLRMPAGVAERGRSGEILTRVSTDLGSLQTYLDTQLYNLIYQPLLFLGAFTMLLLVQWRLVLLCALLAPPAILLSQWIGKPIRTYSLKTMAKQDRLNADAKEAVEGMPVIHAFGLSGLFTRRFRQLADDALTSSMALERRKAVLSPVGVIAYSAPVLIGVAVGGRWVQSGLMSVSDILLFLYLLVFLIQPLSLMPALIGATNEASAAAKRLGEWMELPQEASDLAEHAGLVQPTESGGPVGQTRQAGPVVEFEDVSFAYDDGETVLHQLSFSIPAGRIVAVVGPSGAGKSTLTRLICGGYSSTGHLEGTIRLFGRNAADWQLNELRRHIAVVAQEPYLFPMSIEDNIRSGCTEATAEEIVGAAMLANAHEFIERLPRGYATRLGERGAGLSRGERQRISIARAIMKDAPLLLLDEASSALDPRSEALVGAALQSYARGRTVLIIAHRLSSIRMADEIWVMEGGRIVERGAYNELLKRPGSRFRQLFGEQADVAAYANADALEGGERHAGIGI
ncbi:ABC transporter ATP-binding protein [Paenibacillus xylaniclasticus]|uniref:ABC transporter ATP-binding protein n=1 Tax=Paenibacillus xylaniclasticus TaxID=588083 RepID=UPI000FD75007|nr:MULTISPECIES: ABC transporter ATP-binding protein [Paenibacillus]GFN29932.1 ABC transporter ATP-binding protein [Paenibacillus curdlanolyticus]